MTWPPTGTADSSVIKPSCHCEPTPCHCERSVAIPLGQEPSVRWRDCHGASASQWQSVGVVIAAHPLVIASEAWQSRWGKSRQSGSEIATAPAPRNDSPWGLSARPTLLSLRAHPLSLRAKRGNPVVARAVSPVARLPRRQRLAMTVRGGCQRGLPSCHCERSVAIPLGQVRSVRWRDCHGARASQ